MTDDYDPTDEELLALQAELDALEATDPDVARAAENYRRVVEAIRNHEEPPHA
jgi:hypothetical protein